MKEGILLYIAQGKLANKDQLARFVEVNSLEGILISVSSQSKESLTFYQAYMELASKGVDIVECFSAKLNGEGELELLKANITLPVGIDLLKFCTPEELGLAGDAGTPPKSTNEG